MIYRVAMKVNGKKYIVDNVPGLNGKYALKRAIDLAEAKWGTSAGIRRVKMDDVEIQLYDPTIFYSVEDI